MERTQRKLNIIDQYGNTKEINTVFSNIVTYCAYCGKKIREVEVEK